MSESDSSTSTKVCTKCGREHPATLEYFCRERAGKYGLCSRCKTCAAARHATYRATHRDEVAAYNAEHCVEMAAYAAAYRAEHREEKAAYAVAYRAEHPDDGAAYAAAYYVEHREEKAANNAAYRAEHSEELAAYHAAYRAEHPEEFAAYARNRDARKLSNGGTHTAEDVRAQYARQKGTCYWCLAKVGDTYHVDHVMPVILGGSNGPENLVIACPTCNLSKGAKHPQDFCGRLL